MESVASYTECRDAECHYTVCLHAECHYDGCRAIIPSVIMLCVNNAEYHFAIFHYAKCHHAELCCGPLYPVSIC